MWLGFHDAETQEAFIYTQETHIMIIETPRTNATGDTIPELRRIAKQLESELQGRERQIAMIQEDRERLVESNQELLSRIEEAKEMLLEAANKLQEAGVRE